ncbi:MAG TPA: CAP domain-containing protein [Verrucomicrobiales bacterium]|nr:CAP domain-containing protein [Verrucomicrobiales bacterium]
MEPVSDPDAPVMPQPRTTLWSIGNPTDQEQLYLELINRARANPAAEGARLATLADPDVQASYSYFHVNLSMMQAEMSALPVAPPLAMNAKLLASARGHSDDQFTNQFQGHEGTNGSTIGQRLTAAGYSATYYAENVYAYSKNTGFGHAGFEVDWGSGSGGMQDPRGHRQISHAGFREVGIGIREGTNGSFGPQVVTQDYGYAAGGTPFVTGTAYYDFNGNNFYDPGEGLGGVTVNVEGSAFHGVTASSGGYAVPVPAGAATRLVTFTGLGFNTTATATLTGSNNTRVDLKPVYSPPLVTGATNPVVALPASYQISAMGGASSYDWRAMRPTPASADNANDLSRVNTVTSNYTVLSTAVKQEGTGSYHLAQPGGKNEVIVYKSTLHGGSAPSMQFQSRLAAATTNQKAYIQVSTNGGASWTIVDTQTGSGNGQSNFSLRSVSLASVAGRDFLLRFNFTVTGTPFNTGTGNNTGWFIDAVNFTDIVDTAGATVTASPGQNFFFTPPATGIWLLSARPIVSGRTLEFGPVREVDAVIAPPLPVYAVWATQFELSAGLLPGTISGAPTADYNKDGIANLVAYGLGLSPVSASSTSLPQAAAAGNSLRLDYLRHTDRLDVSVTPQISTDMQTWYNPGQPGAPAGFTDGVVSAAGTVQTRRATVPVSGRNLYLRLKVTQL